MSSFVECGKGWLGFHRLAIMGLNANGMQPFRLDGDMCVCNGELYGFRPIKTELVGMGYADSVIPKGAAVQLLPRLAPEAGWVSLRPRQYDTFAVVHRAGATLSPAAQLMIELATKRLRAIADPL